MATKENQKPFETYDPSKFLTSPNFQSLDAQGKYFEYLSAVFGEALNTNGHNVSNPEIANMFYYNKIQKKDNLEPPRVGKTYVFFTRPDCCWSMPNITSAPDIEYIFHTPIGKQLLCMLTTPDRYIAGSYMKTHNYSRAMLAKEEAEIKKMRRKMIDNSDAPDKEFDKFSQETYYILRTYYESSVAEQYRKSFETKIIRDDGRIDVEATKVYTKPEHNYENWAEGTTYYGSKVPGLEHAGKYTSSFIPLLSNTCIEAPAGNDLTLETVETAKDFYGNSLVYGYDSDERNAPTEITFSFENTASNSVFLLFYLWVSYIRNVARGRFYARYSDVINRIIDYTSSFFVFVTDVDGITLKGWARGMGCFPLNVPLGGLAHSREPNVDSWRNIAIPFKVNKYRVMDPQDLMDFNFFSTKEWLQKPKYDDTYFTIDRMQKKKQILGKDYFMAVAPQNRGLSGKLPQFALTPGDAYRSSNIFRYNNVWGGYPYIADGCKLVFVDPNDFKDIAYMGENETKWRF